MGKIFYICSYGGCGSTVLANSLSNYGEIRHIHSRNPPDKLQYIGNDNGGKCYNEWFNGINIPYHKLENYYVIYIYRKPIKSILSRFTIPQHLEHIQVDKNIKIDQVINTGKDLYKIREFYNNYTQTNINRNYKIYSVKYEELFDNQDKLSDILGIGPLDMVKRETLRDLDKDKMIKLNIIYNDLIKIMDFNDFIKII